MVISHNPHVEVELLTDSADEELMRARCVVHLGLGAEICTWTDTYDTTDDAWMDADRHTRFGG